MQSGAWQLLLPRAHVHGRVLPDERGDALCRKLYGRGVRVGQRTVVRRHRRARHLGHVRARPSQEHAQRAVCSDSARVCALRDEAPRGAPKTYQPVEFAVSAVARRRRPAAKDAPHARITAWLKRTSYE